MTIFLIYTIATSCWTLQDRTPPAWDPADHIAAGYDYFAPLAHLNFGGFAREFFIEPHFYAPFVHLITAFFFAIFGASRFSGIAVNFASLAVLLGSIYWISKRVFANNVRTTNASSTDHTKENDQPTDIPKISVMLMGVMAALLGTSYHFSAWLLHDGFLDYPLMAIVAAGYAALLNAGDFHNRRAAILFGVIAGCGMLTKQTFGFFFVLPAIYVAIRVLLTRNIKAIMHLLLAAVILCALTASWYLPHLCEVQTIFKINNEAAIAEHEAPLFSFDSNLYYLHALFSQQMQLPFALLFLFGLIYSLVRYRQQSLLLYLWLLSGIGAFSMLPNKDLRYSVPVLPAAALLSVCWVGRLRFERRAPGMTFIKSIPLLAITIWAFVSFFNAQFPAEGMGVFIDSPGYRFMVFARNYYGFDHRPWRSDWGVPEAVKAIQNDWEQHRPPKEKLVRKKLNPICSRDENSQMPEGYYEKPVVGVVVNLPFLNPSNFNLYGRLLTQKRGEMPLLLIDWLTSETLKNHLEDCDYLVIRTRIDKGGQTAGLEPYARDWVKANAAELAQIAAYPIPIEGAEVQVYRRLR
jgi:4-amino-4-deoxy-L-arabinose transferase-like glycosyltransferase